MEAWRIQQAVSLLGSQEVSPRPRFSFPAGSERLGTCLRSHSEVGHSSWVLWQRGMRLHLPDKLWAEMQRLLPHHYHLTSRTPNCLTSATLASALIIPSQSVLPGSYPHFHYILFLLHNLRWLIIALRLKIELLLLTFNTL